MDPIAEIRALRDRLARLEAVATAATQPTEGAPNMENAIRSHYSPTAPPPDREQARRQAIADRFQVDPQLEASIAARARMGAEAYDAEMARVGAGQKLEMALYQRDRGIAIKLGTFVPAKEEGTK